MLCLIDKLMESLNSVYVLILSNAIKCIAKVSCLKVMPKYIRKIYTKIANFLY